MPTLTPNISNVSVLPPDVQAKLAILDQQLADEEITAKGYHKFRGHLLQPHRDTLLAEEQRIAAIPVVSPPTTVTPTLSSDSQPTSPIQELDGRHQRSSDFEPLSEKRVGGTGAPDIVAGSSSSPSFGARQEHSAESKRDTHEVDSDHADGGSKQLDHADDRVAHVTEVSCFHLSFNDTSISVQSFVKLSPRVEWERGGGQGTTSQPVWEYSEVHAEIDLSIVAGLGS